MELPELCAVLRAELELPTELRAKALIDAACAVIGCAFQGTLVERAQRCVSLLDAAAQAKGQQRPRGGQNHIRDFAKERKTVKYL